MQGLERMHYFDGQLLKATDFELEQTYHMRVRRLLNHGLYSPGVVTGLEVSEVDSRHVRVTAGMSLDPSGREVIMLSDTVQSVPSRLPVSALGGYFLTIRYGEQQEPGIMADCKNGSGTTPPARIREAPVLAWTETWPNQQLCGEKGHSSDCAIVLALVLLDNSCRITSIESGVRQYSHSQLPGQVHPFALEGEKDIDSLNPKTLHFQIRGGPPDSVLLYLWGDAISSLFYSELGSHTHDIGGVGIADTTTDLGNHTHQVPDMTSSSDGTHSHKVRIAGELFWNDITKTDSIYTGPFTAIDQHGDVSVGRIDYGPQGDLQHSDFFIQDDGQHQHTVKGPVTQGPNPNASTPHHHTMSGNVGAAGATANAASTAYQARTGEAYGYPSGVRVKLDGTDITAQILGYLGWTELGDGTNGHTFVTSGTGGIDLVKLGLTLAVGSHTLQMLVPSGGGKVLYNLYVE